MQTSLNDNKKLIVITGVVVILTVYSSYIFFQATTL